MGLLLKGSVPLRKFFCFKEETYNLTITSVIKNRVDLHYNFCSSPVWPFMTRRMGSNELLIIQQYHGNKISEEIGGVEKELLAEKVTGISTNFILVGKLEPD